MLLDNSPSSNQHLFTKIFCCLLAAIIALVSFMPITLHHDDNLSFSEKASISLAGSCELNRLFISNPVQNSSVTKKDCETGVITDSHHHHFIFLQDAILTGRTTFKLGIILFITLFLPLLLFVNKQRVLLPAKISNFHIPPLSLYHQNTLLRI